MRHGHTTRGVDGRRRRGRRRRGGGSPTGVLVSGDAAASPAPPGSGDWASVRAQFAWPRLSPLRRFVFASHPASVRDAIERHREGLDADANGYLPTTRPGSTRRPRPRRRSTWARARSGGAHRLHHDGPGTALHRPRGCGPAMRCSPPSTTSTPPTSRCGCAPPRRRHRAAGPPLRRPGAASADEIVARLVAPRSRPRPGRGGDLGALLHRASSCRSGRSPTSLGHVNRPRRGRARRAALRRRRARLRRRGHHPAELGCDFLVSGCHKWLFGPRGTGLVWGRAEAWAAVDAGDPAFAAAASAPGWGSAPTGPPGPAATPGGYHSFEHRWALAEAFEFRRRDRPRSGGAPHPQLASR